MAERPELMRILEKGVMKAAQMAYVENAQGTHTLLVHLDAVLRYRNRENRDVRLSEELAATRELLEWHRRVFPDRFTYRVDSQVDTTSDSFVYRGSVMDPCLHILDRWSRTADQAIELSLSIGSDGRVVVDSSQGAPS